MTLTESWNAYMEVLRRRAPMTAAVVRPPRDRQTRMNVERATTPWPDELHEFFSLHDGQLMPTGASVYVGTVLPDRLLFGLDEVAREHRRQLENPFPIYDLGEDWPARIETQAAGESAHMFLPEYVPFGADGSFSLDYVDTRRGPHHGCVRFFGGGGADEGGPEYDSLADYVESLLVSVDTGVAHVLVPTFENDALVWTSALTQRD
ncbi:SMI1/KNR4 family protein [Rhodococcus kroppenstedtii]|uniref:SMI1/KNR4 family protein n=1 Tax=Rhodococcoides kroppenstedtii TaxID=293050 RepID=UPI001C9B9FBB|nr:SMI1/KNR4 family protein [Rhodococcus kroppenstedtii]MBY6438395.1 SMI1/KNR4 family protein [Rhodococcus kroppenstedtii]